MPDNPMLVLILAMPVLFWLENLRPLEAKKLIRPRFWSDWLFVAFGPFLNRWFHKPVMLLAMLVLQELFPSFLKPVTQTWPIWLQVLVLAVLIDGFVYWGHRLEHQVSGLWKFHAIHHSAEELDPLVGARVHPFDYAFLQLFVAIPIYALGVSYEVILYFEAINGFFIWAQHANTRFDFGPLKWLMITPGFHHWHHHNTPGLPTYNYAGLFPVWDVLFGTCYMPTQADKLPSVYGVSEKIPNTYLAQLLYPFKKTKAEVSPGVVTLSTPEAKERLLEAS